MSLTSTWCHWHHEKLRNGGTNLHDMNITERYLVLSNLGIVWRAFLDWLIMVKIRPPFKFKICKSLKLVMVIACQLVVFSFSSYFCPLPTQGRCLWSTHHTPQHSHKFFGDFFCCAVYYTLDRCLQLVDHIAVQRAVNQKVVYEFLYTYNINTSSCQLAAPSYVKHAGQFVLNGVNS